MSGVYATLKGELVEQRDYLTHAEARADIFQFLEGWRCLSKELSGAHQVASLILRSLVSRSGLRQTSPTGAQFRIWRDHRVGLAARASV